MDENLQFQSLLPQQGTFHIPHQYNRNGTVSENTIHILFTF